MRSLALKLMAVAVATLPATPAFAQFAGGPGLGMTGPALLTNKSVQDELKLSDDQKAVIKKIRDKLNEDIKHALADKKPARIQTAQQEAGKALAKVKDELKPAQAKRFKQITLQLSGGRALVTPEVQKELGLSEKQSDQIKEVLADAQTQSLELFKDAGGSREKRMEAFKKAQEISKKATEKAVAVLNPGQKKKWDALTGPKFDYKPNGR